MEHRTSAKGNSDNMTAKSEPESDEDSNTPSGPKRQCKVSVEIQTAKRRCTYSQLVTLWKFLNENRKLAVGVNKSKFDRHHSMLMWKKAADNLNSIDNGAVRSGPEWSKYWVDLKSAIKRKNRLINEARSGGNDTDLELTELERKFLNICDQVKPSVSQGHEDSIVVQSKPGTSQSTANESDVYLIVASSEHENNLGLRNKSPSPSETSDREGPLGRGLRILLNSVQADPQSSSSEQRRQSAKKHTEEYLDNSAEFDSDNMSTKSEDPVSDELSDYIPSSPEINNELIIEMQSTRRRVSYNQLHNLWAFLSKHRKIAVGGNKTVVGREYSTRMWQKVADILNSTGDGIAKTGLEWSKYWADLKYKIRHKRSELIDIERKFLSIIKDTQEPKDNIGGQTNPGTSRSAANEEDVFYIVAASKNNQVEEHKPDVASPPPAETSDEEEEIGHDPLGIPSKQVEDNPPPKPVHVERNREQRPRSVTPSDTPASRPEDTEEGTRRRRRRMPTIKSAEARTRLVKASEARAQAEVASSRSMEKAVGILNDIAITLRRIEAKLPARAPMGRP
ncbi:hypothetical protein ABMA27_006181 [Loxostege sticticalis]|uniref:Regulatory protein zeste n=1 Tax=Loxostege sticticalis TaxID=481309 RepID=A0ABR3HHV8_LOXSC